MPEERNYYVICDDNCRFEGMTKDQILTAIMQAVEEHGTRPIDVLPAESIREINSNSDLSIWIGTQAEFEALESADDGVLYVIAEHNAAKNEIIAEIEALNTRLTDLSSDLENVVSDVQELKSLVNYQQQRRSDIRDGIAGKNQRAAGIHDSIEKTGEKAEIINSVFTTDIEARESQEVLFDTATSVTTSEKSLPIMWGNYSELVFVFSFSDTNETTALTICNIPVNDLDGKKVSLNLNNIGDAYPVGKSDDICTIEFIDTGSPTLTDRFIIKFKRNKYYWTVKLEKIIGIG